VTSPDIAPPAVCERLSRSLILLSACSAMAVASPGLRAQDSSATEPNPLFLGAQITVIGQRLQPFHSPYSGTNSLIATGDTQASESFGLYLGQRIGRRLQLYLDFEMVRGAGVGRVVGLGGPTNGDVIRQGSADLGMDPYVARVFFRYAIPLGTGSDTLQRAQDQVPVVVPQHRLEVIGGKLALSDLFDLNRYANSTRTQFMDWGFFQNTAWDFAADTRGYTNGIAIAWVNPRWTLRAGSFQMPTKANGNEFDSDIAHARGDNLELTIATGSTTPVVRLLAYLNHARMGRYQAAIDSARATGRPPDIVADDAPGRSKYGFGLNVEQPIADAGETGAFLRLGWNDGHTESFAFAEVDRHLSTGVQLSGVHWRRNEDRVGVALLAHGLSSLHSEYLSLGGLGFLLGDGRLHYGPEEMLELYYRTQLGRFVQLGANVQGIEHPGYNRDRGPAVVWSLRGRVAY
jgi:hypothetical protein